MNSGGVHAVVTHSGGSLCCAYTLWRQVMLCSHTLEAVHAVLTHSEIRKWDLLAVGEAIKHAKLTF